MTTYKDTDLREALRRKYADTPQLPSDFLNRMQQAPRPKKQRASTPLHYVRGSRSIERPFWPSGGWVGIAAALLIAFLIWPESHEDTTTQPEVKPIVAKAGPQSVPQPIVEETKEKKDVVLAEAQPTHQPSKKHRKALRKQSPPIDETVPAQTEQPTQGQGQDFEPMYTQAEEHDTHYQTIQTVHLSSDVVVYVIEASDMPAASTVPSVSELRARGLRLTNNVRQASQTTVKF